eukprot:scaffold8710_cov118-Isochrysis_galbana.AAC.4
MLVKQGIECPVALSHSPASARHLTTTTRAPNNTTAQPRRSRPRRLPTPPRSCLPPLTLTGGRFLPDRRRPEWHRLAPRRARQPHTPAAARAAGCGRVDHELERHRVARSGAGGRPRGSDRVRDVLVHETHPTGRRRHLEHVPRRRVQKAGGRSPALLPHRGQVDERRDETRPVGRPVGVAAVGVGPRRRRQQHRVGIDVPSKHAVAIGCSRRVGCERRDVAAEAGVAHTGHAERSGGSGGGGGGISRSTSPLAGLVGVCVAQEAGKPGLELQYCRGRDILVAQPRERLGT